MSKPRPDTDEAPTVQPEPPRVALVTGAARRVGAAISRHLHGLGWNVAIHCRTSRHAADRLADALNASRPGSAAVLQTTLDCRADCQSLVEMTIVEWGRLDALVNNASSFHATPIGDIADEDFATLFAPNAYAPVLLAQAAAAELTLRRGAIVNLADIYADRPLADHLVYSMAKAALIAATRGLAVELGPAIRVNAVAPGAVLWPESGLGYTDREALIAAAALQREGSAEDVARAVAFLLGDATFTTGQVLRVDGGRHLRG